MMRLPIEDVREKIVETVCNNPVTILVGETGSGKTTQLPLILHEAGFGKEGVIGITEPRRLAAISVARHVSRLFGKSVGGAVGYQVRFQDTTDPATRIKFMTDGILAREFCSDPRIKRYSVVVVDEAHERSQNVDLILGLLKDCFRRRKDFRVVVASATIDEAKFSRYFWNAPVVRIPGRTFPVDVVWAKKDLGEGGVVSAAVDVISDIHAKGKPGDVLVFMPGESEIRDVIQELERRRFNNLVTLPLHGMLPPEDQEKVFLSHEGKRRVIVSTNIAETSLTIEGVSHVVDSGLVKQKEFDPESGVESLVVVPHSQSGCDQRAGRAGRVTQGLVYRLYTEQSFRARPRFTEPEVCRTSLASAMLSLEEIGLDSIERFDFIDPPRWEAFSEARNTLIALGAVGSGKRGLTEIGRAMADLPVDPYIARMVLEAAKYGCVMEVVTAAAFFSVRPVFFRRKENAEEVDRLHSRFKHPDSDVLTYLALWEEYERSEFALSWCFQNSMNARNLREVRMIRTQLLQILAESGIELSAGASPQMVSKAVASGLAYNLLEHDSRFSYRGVFRETISRVFVHPQSGLFFGPAPRWIVAASIGRTTRLYAKDCIAVEPEWLPDIVPQVSSLGEPTLTQHPSGDKWVLVERPVIYRGRTVTKTVVRMARDAALKLQAEFRSSMLR
jgi:RNA helicase HrpA